jgi:hypothetical protein
MNDGGWIEKFNSLVRGLVTLALMFGFVWGFVIAKVVSVDAYIGILASVTAWWFASRASPTRSTDAKPAEPPAPPVEPPK